MVSSSPTNMKGFERKVKRNEAGERLDVWLCRHTGLSRKRIKRLIDDHMVRVNGKPIYIAGYSLEEDNEVRLEDVQPPKIKVLYEDSDILIISKPSGLLSVPAPKSKRPSAVDSVRNYLMGKFGRAGTFVRPMHRLDIGTSGAMIFAISKKGMAVMNLFRSHSIDRFYLGVVKGRIEKDKGIKKPLRRGRFARGKKTEVGAGKESKTSFRVKEIYPNATTLEIQAHTGRTHQIRAHLASIGHPLVGDDIYGKREDFHRPALHAHRVIFKHPSSGKKLDITAPIPKDMRKLIDKLRGI